jgi:hypothetical protein
MDLYESSVTHKHNHVPQVLTFQALGWMRRTSSRQNIACSFILCVKYKSASSAQASASDGDVSSNSTSFVIASCVFPIDLSNVILRLWMT